MNISYLHILGLKDNKDFIYIFNENIIIIYRKKNL